MANTKGGDVLNKKRKKPAPMLVFSLRIDEKTLKTLKKLARKEEKTAGKLIRLAIAQFLTGEKHD